MIALAAAIADGKIVEMQTGEGKTLAAVPAIAWFARGGHGVPVLTANDYLARRDAEWMRPIYERMGLSVLPIPTHRPLVRIDHPDRIFPTRVEKDAAVVEEILSTHATGRPVLVGTASVEESERLSRSLRTLPHHVLNARYGSREAAIIAQAGQRGAITISTNMAGRGVDIVLGEGVAQLGGLHIIGTNRHESRRIDHQLRGRAGRQGDPGSSQCFVSLEDALFAKYGDEDPGVQVDQLQRIADVPAPSRCDLDGLVEHSVAKTDHS